MLFNIQKKNLFYGCCHVCAYKLCKGENGTNADIICTRCRSSLADKIQQKVKFVCIIYGKSNLEDIYRAIIDYRRGRTRADTNKIKTGSMSNVGV